MRYDTSSISLTGSNMDPPPLGHYQRGVSSCPPQPQPHPSVSPSLFHTHIHTHFCACRGVLLAYNNLLWKSLFSMDQGFSGAKYIIYSKGGTRDGLTSLDPCNFSFFKRCKNKRKCVSVSYHVFERW